MDTWRHVLDYTKRSELQYLQAWKLALAACRGLAIEQSRDRRVANG